jgi:hypothetical protein
VPVRRMLGPPDWSISSRTKGSKKWIDAASTDTSEPGVGSQVCPGMDDYLPRPSAACPPGSVAMPIRMANSVVLLYPVGQSYRPIHYGAYIVHALMFGIPNQFGTRDYWRHAFLFRERALRSSHLHTFLPASSPEADVRQRMIDNHIVYTGGLTDTIEDSVLSGSSASTGTGCTPLRPGCPQDIPPPQGISDGVDNTVCASSTRLERPAEDLSETSVWGWEHAETDGCGEGWECNSARGQHMPQSEDPSNVQRVRGHVLPGQISDRLEERQAPPTYRLGGPPTCVPSSPHTEVHTHAAGGRARCSHLSECGQGPSERSSSSVLLECEGVLQIQGQRAVAEQPRRVPSVGSTSQHLQPAGVQVPDQPEDAGIAAMNQSMAKVSPNMGLRRPKGACTTLCTQVPCAQCAAGSVCGHHQAEQGTQLSSLSSAPCCRHGCVEQHPPRCPSTASARLAQPSTPSSGLCHAEHQPEPSLHCVPAARAAKAARAASSEASRDGLPSSGRCTTAENGSVSVCVGRVTEGHSGRHSVERAGEAGRACAASTPHSAVHSRHGTPAHRAAGDAHTRPSTAAASFPARMEGFRFDSSRGLHHVLVREPAARKECATLRHLPLMEASPCSADSLGKSAHAAHMCRETLDASLVGLQPAG